ncbi:CDP-alcohol phosphatidyltransferase family protein [Bradyrhizobium oligotrophicum]|uniref:CDP-alcohol phosphatidyltransferase family protein n=1 Tax=Bradyrhizobium oligotrophicum TaxID=44255 RepID=UPI003EBFCBD6
MSRSLRTLAAIQAISIFRLLGAVLFTALAFQNVPPALLCGVYVVAAISDLLDGFVARKLAATSFAGGILDLISDKSLTVVSLLYAAAKGVPLFPLAIIGTRELISLGLRMVMVDGRALWPTSRWFGGTMTAVLWGNTFVVILRGPDKAVTSIAVGIFWGCAVVSFLDLARRLFSIRRHITRALAEEAEPD